jgi:hypothetical protein
MIFIACIVSAYITIVAIELRIATTLQAERGIISPEYGVDNCTVRLGYYQRYYYYLRG